MRDAADSKSCERRGPSRAAHAAAARVFVLLCAAGLLCAFAAARRSPASPTGTDAARFVRAAAARQEGGVTKFSHSTPKHAELACDSCHGRVDNSPRPRLPGHKACTDCHIREFLTAGGPLCSNCHTSLEGGDPPLKAFPGLASFNMRFSHASHTSGGGRPEQGCASCHRPARRGVALSIPAGASAHENCYACHTPGARAPGGGDISSCATCHARGGYSRTPAASRAYAVSFSHAGHGARQRLGCDDCHQVRAGAGQGRQVTAPRPSQHFGSARAQSCLTCHDNRRAFGGDDFADCKRCHQGQTFRF
ncbi:MAG TPA: cytochrome c3 family protein [Pyrinomonadaceae bacterium]|jgi:c(7)-type cytochrome triheme protein